MEHEAREEYIIQCNLTISGGQYTLVDELCWNISICLYFWTCRLQNTLRLINGWILLSNYDVKLWQFVQKWSSESHLRLQTLIGRFLPLRQTRQSLSSCFVDLKTSRLVCRLVISNNNSTEIRPWNAQTGSKRNLLNIILMNTVIDNLM